MASKIKDFDDDEPNEKFGNEEKKGSIVSEKGLALLEKAEKQKKSFFRHFDKKNNDEKIIDLYQRAGTQFQLEHNWNQAANAFFKSAVISEELEEDLDTLILYDKSRKMFELGDQPEEVHKCYDIIINKHIYNSNIPMCSKMLKKQAEAYQKKLKFDKAIEKYELSANYFRADSSFSEYYDCIEKISTLLMQKKKYLEAFKKWKIIIDDSNIRNDLTSVKFKITKWYFNMLLCLFVHLVEIGDEDLKELSEELEKGCYNNLMFTDSRESKLIENLIIAYTDQNENKFSDVLFEFDNIQKLTDEQVNLFLYIKQKITNPVKKDIDLT